MSEGPLEQVLRQVQDLQKEVERLKVADTVLATHTITGTKHSYSGGAARDLFGLTAPSTIGVITPSSNPGATPRVLVTDINGLLQLAGLGIGVAGAAGQLRTSGAVLIGTSVLTANQMLDVLIADDTGNAGITMRNSDGSLLLLNGTGTADRFLPGIKGNSKNSAVMGLVLTGNGAAGDDAGAIPLLYLRSSINDGVVATRPLVGIYNYTTAQAQFDVGGHLRLLGGLYVGSLGVAPTADDIYCDGVISTDGGTTKWELGGYTLTAPAATGYVTVTIDGVAYQFLVKKV